MAYLGNKRRLLPFIARGFDEAVRLLGITSDSPLSFADPFCGSGSVCRLARHRGWAVHASDLEYYAALMARSRLMAPSRLEAAFAAEGGSAAAFAALDLFARGSGDATCIEKALDPLEAAVRERWRAALEAANEKEPWLARHYAPRDTEHADWRSERLFYTAENARYLDRARNAVAELWPFDPLAADTRSDAPAALVEALLYEAATHANTSGVFKACHRGFGGHGRDALSRILQPMQIEPPCLVDGPPSTTRQADAAEALADLDERGTPVDIAYLDPPYNQHQYGSNYHLLTSIARWDKPVADDRLDERGWLSNRSGIRKDWTRSPWCRKESATAAFEALLAATKARVLLVSYNDGGHIPRELILERLAAKGAVHCLQAPYTAYPGGRQSAKRLQATSEYLFVCDTQRPPAPESGGIGAQLRERLETLDRRARITALAAARFDHPRLALPPELKAALAPKKGGRIRIDQGLLDRLAPASLAILEERLTAARLDSPEECLERCIAAREWKEALTIIRPLAFARSAARYRALAARLKGALERDAPIMPIPAGDALPEGAFEGDTPAEGAPIQGTPCGGRRTRSAAARGRALAALEKLETQARRRGVHAAD